MVAFRCLSLLATLVFAVGADQSPALLHKLNASLSYDDVVLVFALQGACNSERSGGTRVPLFLDVNSLFYNWPPSDSHWVTYLSTQRPERFAFQALPDGDICALVEATTRNVPDLSVARTDPNVDATRSIALTLTGLNDTIPVSSDQLERYPCLASLPVTSDLRGYFTSDAEAYSWSLAHLAPKTLPHAAYSLGHNHDNVTIDPWPAFGLDWAISRGLFIFNLSPDNKYPSEAALFDQIMGQIGTDSVMYGWAEPEMSYTARVSAHGGIVLNDQAPNLSFWGRLPPTRSNLQWPVSHLAPPDIDNSTYYLVFQTNEGDTAKILASQMNGEWLSDTRGSAPVAWGVNPLLNKLLPALVSFYLDTATSNDTFFAGPSGAGYIYPTPLTPDALTNYTRRVNALVQEYGPQWADIWDTTCDDAGKLSAYHLGAPSLHGLSRHGTPNGNATNCFFEDKTPLFSADHTLWYPQLNATHPLDDLESRITRVMQMNRPPFFILVYGLLNKPTNPVTVPEFAAAMANRLGDKGVRVVGVDDLVRLAPQVAPPQFVPCKGM